MRTYAAKEPPRDQNVAASAGRYADSPENSKKTLTDLIRAAYENYTTYPIKIVEGLEFDQFTLLKEIHYYLSSRFLDGDTDDNGEPKYFHNIILPRVQHVTKNIDLDTKDVFVTADVEEGYWFSFLLRNELQQWMQKNQFGSLLNDLCERLPKFGKVIWKKCTRQDGSVYVKEVDLRDVIFDPSAKSIRHSGLFIERAVMAPWEILKKAEEGVWDKQAALRAVNNANARVDKFLKENGPNGTVETEYTLADTIPDTDVYEAYGWFPKEAILEYEGSMADPDEEPSTKGSDDEFEMKKYVYCKVVISGLEAGSMEVLFLEEVDPEEDFPYIDFDLPFKIPGRCLPVSYPELLLGLQARANELVGRFFQGLRFGSLHLYQTRGKTDYNNLLNDAIEGDIIETKSEIVPISNELRAFNQYQVELQNIEAQADRLCNSVEVVTGEALPTNTPFRLGAQLGVAAGKVFERIREDVGLTLTHVFKEWIVPSIMENLSQEHVTKVMGSVEEMKMFDEKYRKFLLADSVKKFVLGNGYLPTEAQMKIVEQELAENLKNEERKVKIKKDYFKPELLETLRVNIDITDERKNFQASKETLSNLLTIVASNPMIFQDPTARVIIGKLLESSGESPLFISSFASQPQPAPQPGAMNAASPAASKFAQNPGDANPAGSPGFAQDNLTPAAQTA